MSASSLSLVNVIIILRSFFASHLYFLSPLPPHLSVSSSSVYFFTLFSLLLLLPLIIYIIIIYVIIIPPSPPHPFSSSRIPSFSIFHLLPNGQVAPFNIPRLFIYHLNSHLLSFFSFCFPYMLHLFFIWSLLFIQALFPPVFFVPLFPLLYSNFLWPFPFLSVLFLLLSYFPSCFPCLCGFASSVSFLF